MLYYFLCAGKYTCQHLFCSQLSLQGVIFAVNLFLQRGHLTLLTFGLCGLNPRHSKCSGSCMHHSFFMILILKWARQDSNLQVHEGTRSTAERATNCPTRPYCLIHLPCTILSLSIFKMTSLRSTKHSPCSISRIIIISFVLETTGF